MKKITKYLCLGFLLLIYKSVFAQIGIRTSAPEPPKADNPVAQYDTTSLYFSPKKLISDPHYYDGQRIMFLPAHFQGERAFNFILGFTVQSEVPQYEYADTVWFKRRKKVRPEDYRVDIPTTNVYKPTRPNGPVYSKEYGINLYLESFGLNGKVNALTFVTPAEEVEGKVFTINSAIVNTSATSSYKEIVLNMVNEEWEDVIFTFKYYSTGYQDLPIVMLAYTDSIQKKYVGKTFVALPELAYRQFAAKSVAANKLYAVKGELRVKELSLYDAGDFTAKTSGTTTYGQESPARFQQYSYLTPFLFINDESGEEVRISLIEKKSSSYILAGNVTGSEDGKVYVELSPNKLLDAEDYYAQLRAEEERKRLEQEALAQARAERYEALKKKYGKGTADLMMEGKVRIGWSKQMCIEGWGEPESINRSSGSWGVHEQWVYGGGNYLYFENGKLTSIQN